MSTRRREDSPASPGQVVGQLRLAPPEWAEPPVTCFWPMLTGSLICPTGSRCCLVNNKLWQGGRAP
jgi:hypothetical protein